VRRGLFQSPEYIQAVGSISDALLPYPEARRAVAQAMRALGSSNVPAALPPLIEAKPA
jgi:hypothetical protein